MRLDRETRCIMLSPSGHGEETPTGVTGGRSSPASRSACAYRRESGKVRLSSVLLAGSGCCSSHAMILPTFRTKRMQSSMQNWQVRVTRKQAINARYVGRLAGNICATEANTVPASASKKGASSSSSSSFRHDMDMGSVPEI